MVENIANYLGEQSEDVTFNVDSVDRVNSSHASLHQLPRVVVHLISKKMKEDIMAKSFKETLEIEGKTVKILRELHKKATNSRKEFKPLADKLKKLKIRFQWEIPRGVSFFFKNKRKFVSDLEAMLEVQKEMEEGFSVGEEDVGKKKNDM